MVRFCLCGVGESCGAVPTRPRSSGNIKSTIIYDVLAYYGGKKKEKINK